MVLSLAAKSAELYAASLLDSSCLGPAIVLEFESFAACPGPSCERKGAKQPWQVLLLKALCDKGPTVPFHMCYSAVVKTSLAWGQSSGRQGFSALGIKNKTIQGYSWRCEPTAYFWHTSSHLDQCNQVFQHLSTEQIINVNECKWMKMNVNELYHWQTASQPMRCTCGHMVMIGKVLQPRGPTAKHLDYLDSALEQELKQCWGMWCTEVAKHTGFSCPDPLQDATRQTVELPLSVWGQSLMIAMSSWKGAQWPKTNTSKPAIPYLGMDQQWVNWCKLALRAQQWIVSKQEDKWRKSKT